MKKTILWLAVVLVFALVFWRAWLHNRPEAPGEEWQSGRHSFRGHKPLDKLKENLAAGPVEGTYPPRALGLHGQRKPPSDSWLLDADSDTDRFRRLEVVLGGADISMLEIGLRFEVLHAAIASGDLDLARFEMDRIVRSANVALLKRPGFKEDAGLEYLGRIEWLALRSALDAKDPEAAKAGFLGVRGACMACHGDRKMEFLNGDAAFTKTGSFAAAEGIGSRQSATGDR